MTEDAPLPKPVADLPYIENGGRRYVHESHAARVLQVKRDTLRTWRNRGEWPEPELHVGRAPYYRAQTVANKFLRRFEEVQPDTPEAPIRPFQTPDSPRDTGEILSALPVVIAEALRETLQGRDALVARNAVLEHRNAEMAAEIERLKAEAGRGRRDKLTLQERLTGRLDGV